MSAALVELLKHVTPCRLTLTSDARRLRCHDHDVWIALPSAVPSTSNVDTPTHPREDLERCGRHRGQWAHACSPCRADELVDREAFAVRHIPTGSPATDEYRAARAALARRPVPAPAAREARHAPAVPAAYDTQAVLPAAPPTAHPDTQEHR